MNSGDHPQRVISKGVVLLRDPNTPRVVKTCSDAPDALYTCGDGENATKERKHA